MNPALEAKLRELAKDGCSLPHLKRADDTTRALAQAVLEFSENTVLCDNRKNPLVSLATALGVEE